MTTKYFILVKTALLLSFFLIYTGCDEDNLDQKTGPNITVQQDNLSFDGLNVGDEIVIPIEVQSENGVKRIAWFFIQETANGTESGPPTYLDDPDMPKNIETDIQFDAVPGILELVIVAFDRQNVSSEVHIAFTNIRGLPQLTFNGGIKYRETVFENKNLAVTGNISSEFDISRLTYATIINDVVNPENDISFVNKKDIDFEANVKVVKGLEGIIIKATNIHQGTVVDTFTIGSVVDDAVAITMQNGITEVEKIYTEKSNTFGGTISSGSNIVSFTYAIKQNDVYGEEMPIPLGTPLDEFDFSVSFNGEEGMQALRFTGRNENSNLLELELPIQRVYMPLVYLQDVELTTEIGAGKHNWFAAYLEPHVFDLTTAAENQEMMDIVVAVRGSALRFMPPAIFEAGSYLATVAPYLVGFTQATYTVVTSNRSSITPEAMSSLEYDEDIETFIREKIMAPTSEGGESYNVVGTNRRVSSDLTANSGLIIGWGSYTVDGVANNQAFALIYMKEVELVDGIGHVKFDIKFPKTDNRTLFNPVSIRPYNP